MKKKMMIIAVAALMIVAGVVVGYKYRYKINRILKELLASEGKISCLEVADTGGWNEADIANIEIEKNQSLMLINTDNMLAEDFEAEVFEYKTSGVIMNKCIMDAYEQLAGEVKSRFDQKLYVRSAYRSAEEQKQQIEENGEKATEVGSSEHQAGLALDVYVPYFAGGGFTDCKAGQWVNKECGEYGFIIRYPSYGRKSTGMDYEPWHIRYVGFPHSKIIMDSKSTLESYIAFLKKDVVYQYDEYYICRTEGDRFKLPNTYEYVMISPDNTGAHIITIKK